MIIYNCKICMTCNHYQETRCDYVTMTQNEFHGKCHKTYASMTGGNVAAKDFCSDWTAQQFDRRLEYNPEGFEDPVQYSQAKPPAISPEYNKVMGKVFTQMLGGTLQLDKKPQKP